MIPVNEPSIGARELEYVTEALQSGWISSDGKYIRQFEEDFARFCGRKHGIAVNNGTSALILAVRALNLPRGTEVILPTFTIISCALACIYNDLAPVFVDSESETWNMDLNKLEERITSRTSAIMPVHIYGEPVQMDRLLEIASGHRLRVIEDFAEAIGSEFRGKRCGGFGDVSCASFYANKVITTGEGGMCLTDDDSLASRMRSFRNLAFIPEERFRHEELGFNFRMTNVQAAIGCAQTQKVEEHVRKKIEIGTRYASLLSRLTSSKKIRTQAGTLETKSTYWMYGIVFDEKTNLNAKKAASLLDEKGIQTRPFFYPMHSQPAFAAYPWHKHESLPVSERLYRQGLYLPSGLTLTEQEQRTVATTLEEVVDFSQNR